MGELLSANDSLLSENFAGILAVLDLIVSPLPVKC
jgi:hypothetical protein